MRGKIRITGPYHSREVQTALFSQGKVWRCQTSPVLQKLEAPAIFFDDKELTWGYQDEFFDEQPVPEYWLVNGELVTSPKPAAAAVAPVVLRSRKVVMQERVKEISQAIIQAVDNGQEIPHNWQRELDDLLSNIRVVRD